MLMKEITLRFDIDDEREGRVYKAIMGLPNFYNTEDLSKALIHFIDNLVDSVGECEERRKKCEEFIRSVVGETAPGTQKGWN